MPTPLTRTQGTLAALAAGILVALSYPNVGIWPLAFVSYAPLLIALRGAGWKRRLLLGWLTGFVINLYLFHWIYFTLVDMSGLGATWAVVGTLGLVMASALHQGLFAVAAEPLRERAGSWGWTLVVPAVFILSERLFPHLFPYHLGNALYPAPALVQHAEVGGVYAVSFTAFLAQSALAEALCGSRSGALRPTAIALGVVLLTGGYGALRISQVDNAPVRKELRALVVQPHIDVAEKRARGSKRTPNYHKIEELTRQSVLPETELVIWPEGGFPFRLAPTLAEQTALADDAFAPKYSRLFADLVRETNRPFLVGSLRQPAPGERLRNTAHHFSPDGELVARYDKRLLVPVGEYVPLRDWFPSLASKVPGSSDMQAGENSVQFGLDAVLVQPSICYEAVFPQFTREASLEPGRSDLIVNFTNDVWFGRTSAPELHLMVQIMRAVELRIPILRSTNTGITALILPTGAVEPRAPMFEPAVLHLAVPIRDLTSPYRAAGDVFLWGVIIAAGVVLLALRRKSAENTEGTASTMNHS